MSKIKSISNIWKKLDGKRQALIKEQLDRILHGEPQLSEESLLDDLSTQYPQELERVTDEINAIHADDLILDS